MKITKIVTISMLLFTTSVSAEENEEVTAEVTGYYQQHNEDVDQLAKLLEIPEVQKFKAECDQAPPDSDETVGECIWGKVNLAENQSIKEKVMAQMDETLAAQENINQYESVSAISLKKEQTQSQKALEKFYAKKISDELYGDTSGPNSKIKILDHTAFNKLYENQLTKNILTAISTLCIEAYIGAGKELPIVFESSTAREKVKKGNITQLSTPASGSGKSGLQTSSTKWTKCMDGIQYLCHGGTKIVKDKSGAVSARPTFSSQYSKDDKLQLSDGTEHKVTEKDIDYSKKRACEVTNYLKIAKQNIKTLKKIDEGYKTVFSKPGYSMQGVDANNNVNTERVVLDKEKINNISNTSSNEFINEAGFAEATKSDLVEFERCFKKTGPGADDYEFQAGAEQNCQKFLNTDRASMDAIKQEHELRQRALIAKMEKLETTGSEDELKQFLLDQGRNEEEIDDQLSNVDIDELKAQISNRYENEKLQLIKSLNEKIESTTSTKDGQIITDTNQDTGDFDKLKKIHDELSSKTKSYAQLIHYNNMVTGLLQVTNESTGTKTRNTASIEAEMADNAFTEGKVDSILTDQAERDAAIANSEGLEAAVSNEDLSSGDSSSDGNDSGATLGVNEINEEILNYDIDPTNP